MANPTLSTQIILFLLLLLCNFFFISESINFTFHGFKANTNTNTNTNLDLDGSIVEESGALRLTNTSKSVIGHAFYPTPIPISNHSISFSTSFVFQINPSSSSGGYGLGFVLSASPRFPGAAAGHYMGVFSGSNNGDSTNRVFMVEFDTVRGLNEESDAEGNHVGINVNGMDSVNKTPALYNGDVLFLEKAQPIHARVDYDGFKKKVNVRISRLNDSEPVETLISTNLDLSDVILSENMYAGFSAATGEDKTSSHYILGWSFRLNGISDKLNRSLLPFIETSPSSSSSKISNKVKQALIATLSIILVVSVVSLVLIVFYRRANMFEALEEWELDCPHRFRYKELYTATKGFRQTEKIGEGGFGVVYHGVLPSTGNEAAIKKIENNNSSQGMREFAAEIECLGKLRHKNLVHLQGWCKRKNELLLVYDYVPNGSLDSLLYKCSNPRSILTWEQRFDIIKGIASGLLYLHEDWEQVVIHRDVKSSNVLIDRDMSPRLGDFGLARLHDHGKNIRTTRVVGTIGYIAPELSRTGKASTSSDVFAFGILLLEIACGRPAVVCEAHQNVILVDWVVECMQKGKIFDAIDAKMDSDFVIGEMELVLGLGLLCSHPNKEMRPKMRQVVKYLNGDEIMPLFERLSSDGSRRVDEITSRLLELGLVDRFSNSTDSYSLSTICIGEMSYSSFEDGR